MKRMFVQPMPILTYILPPALIILLCPRQCSPLVWYGSGPNSARPNGILPGKVDPVGWHVVVMAGNESQ